MVNEEPVDPNSVEAVVDRLGSGGRASVIDLTTAADPAAALDDAAAGLGAAALVVVACHSASGARRLSALAGAAEVPGAFDRQGLLDLLARANLHAVELHGTLEDPVAGSGEAARRVPAGVVEWVRAQPDALVREFIALVRSGVSEQVPALVPAVPENAVRRVDDYTERAERDLRERREVLTVRDHVIGLEATATAAEDRAALRGRRLRETRDKLERREAEVELLRSKVRELQGAGDRPAGKASGLVGRVVRRLRHS